MRIRFFSLRLLYLTSQFARCLRLWLYLPLSSWGTTHTSLKDTLDTYPRSRLSVSGRENGKDHILAGSSTSYVGTHHSSPLGLYYLVRFYFHDKWKTGLIFFYKGIGSPPVRLQSHLPLSVRNTRLLGKTMFRFGPGFCMSVQDSIALSFCCLLSTLCLGVTWVGVICAQCKCSSELWVFFRLISLSVVFLLRAYALWNASRPIAVFLIFLEIVSLKILRNDSGLELEPESIFVTGNA